MSNSEKEWPEFDLTQDADIDGLKEEEKEKLDAAERGELRPSSAPPQPASGGSNVNAWIPGLILIAIGSYFLLANLTGFQVTNWWAFFILIPALGSFGKAWADYRAAGRLTGEARGALIGGLIMSLIAGAFLFSLDWGLIWPFFLIIGGLGALLGALAGD